MGPTRHRLQILAAAMLFSTGGAAIKAVELSSWQVACFRSGLAAAALALAIPAWRRGWTGRTFVVGTAYAATMVTFVLGNKLTTAANTIFLQSTAPMYLLLLGPWLLGERVRRGDVVFTASVASGMVLFFAGAEAPQATAPDPLLGNAFGALAGLCWALTILGLRWLARDPESESTGAAVIAGNSIAFVACLPLALPVVEATAEDWLLVAYLGLFQIGLAYVFLARGVRHLPALETSLLLLVEPVLNAVWAWLILGERPGRWSLAGCVVIFVATVSRIVHRGREAS